MSLTTYRNEGDVIDYTLGSSASAGDIVVAGSLVGQITVDGAAGDKVGLRVSGVINAPKKSSDVVAIGDALYWDSTNSECTKTSTGNTRIGTAVEAAGSGVTDCDVRLVSI